MAVFDGGYALESVVRPLILPEGGDPRIDFLTRLRCNARLYALPLPPEQRPKGKPGPQPKWGQRLEPPRRGGRWKAKWQVGTAFVYGRQRQIRWKEIICLWRVLGWEVPVKAIVASVEGYKQRFTLVTSAVETTGLQMVELFAGGFTARDGFRNLKQRLGWEECRAWTANPIQRTSKAQWVTMSLLRLLQFRLQASGKEGWWFRPPWNKKKDRPSVLDAERLMRRHRERIGRLFSRSGREMRELPRETRHERGIRGCSAGIERCSRSRCSSERNTRWRGGAAGATDVVCHEPRLYSFSWKLLVNTLINNYYLDNAVVEQVSSITSLGHKVVIRVAVHRCCVFPTKDVA